MIKCQEESTAQHSSAEMVFNLLNILLNRRLLEKQSRSKEESKFKCNYLNSKPIIQRKRCIALRRDNQFYNENIIHLKSQYSQPAKLQKSNVEGCIFDYITSHIECRFDKNSLLQCYFLTILPAGLYLLYNKLKAFPLNRIATRAICYLKQNKKTPLYCLIFAF